MENFDAIFEHFNKEMPQGVKERKVHNKEILKLIDAFLEKHPTVRFEQALYILLNGKLEFSRESKTTKEIIEKHINTLKK